MQKAVNFSIAILGLLTALVMPVAQADLISLTGAETAPNIAEITVLDDRVHVALELYPDDLGTFKALLPDKWLRNKGPARASLADRLRQFSTETLRITTGGGELLQARLRFVEPRLRKDRYSQFAGMINPTTLQKIPGPPEDKRVIFVQLDYPFTDKPESIAIFPPQTKDGKAAVTIGFIAYHKTVPIIDFRYLSKPVKLVLDWDDPWYTKFENPNLKRHYQSPVSTYLYMEPREVRHEILFRVRDLLEWTDLGLGSATTIDTAAQSEIKQRTQSFFAGRNMLAVDGMQVSPATSRADFLTASLKGVQVVEDSRSLDLSTALIGIILSYPVEQIPQRVTVKWNLFNERVNQVPATAIDPAGPFLTMIEPDAPVFEWQNFLLKYQEPGVLPVVLDDGRSIGIPVISALFLVVAIGLSIFAAGSKLTGRPVGFVSAGICVLLAGLLFRTGIVKVVNPFAGPPDQEVATKILSEVFTQLNHAYVEKKPAALHKALETVITYESIPEVKQELDRALAIEVTGGGIARVDIIEDMVLKDIATIEDGSGFRALAEWTARANAGHWGHDHRRAFRFRALVELINDSGEWKLAGITVVDSRETV